jgi:Peptidase_C39 like family
MPSLKASLRNVLLCTALLSLVTSPLGQPANAQPPSSAALPTLVGADLSEVTAGRGALTAAAQDEIDRVLAGSTTPVVSRSNPAALASAGVRCANFEGQRYCLGLGWTTDTEKQAQIRIATAATETLGVRRAQRPEKTGDRDALALLRQRAKMSAAQRAQSERRELTAAARSVAKVWLLRHQIQGTPLPAGFLANHPEVTARGGDPVAPTKTAKDYPRSAEILHEDRVNDQRRSYWCGPATMQMIAWTKYQPMVRQAYWAKRMRTTSSGSNITDLVRVINNKTNWDVPSRAGAYVVLDIKSFTFPQWVNLMRRHVVDYRAPVVLHPVLLKEFYPYLDDDASGHFQVGRGYDNNGSAPTKISYFEPWNQQRFDPSEPYIERVQWRNAYKSYRANKEHFLHNVGV